MQFNFDKIYWLFAFAAMFCHWTAVVCTWYALSYLGASECNTAMVSMMNVIGIIPSGILTTLLAGIVIFIVPFVTNQLDKIGLTSAISLGIFVGLLGLDALNDLFVISTNPLAGITNAILIPMIDLVGNGGVC